jgi:hypothetical protein
MTWKKDPRAPLTELSAISPINIGATTEVAPVAKPAMNLAKYRSPTELATTMRIQLRRNGTESACMMSVRPNRSAK